MYKILVYMILILNIKMNVCFLIFGKKKNTQ